MKIRLATAAGVTAAVAAGLLPFSAGIASADQTPNLVGPGCGSYSQR